MKPQNKFPVSLTPANVVKIIISINVIMFVISLIFSGKKTGFTLNPLYLLTPSSDALLFLGATGKLVIQKYNNWFSLISANWLHAGLLHIFFNMMAIRVIVPLVIKEFGLSRMFSLYTLTGAAGFFSSIIGDVHLTIGASSGICGLIGAALYFGKSRGGTWGDLVYRQTAGWIVSLVLIGFMIPNVNNWSHAGGLISGILLGWIFSYNEQRPQNRIDIAIAIILSSLTAWLLLDNVQEGFRLIFF